MTTIAILSHPSSRNGRSTKLRNGRRKELTRTLPLLDKFIDEKRRVAVLASPAPAAEECAKLVAAHYAAEIVLCEGLLCDGKGGNVIEGCDCVDDFVVPKFGLIVAITGYDVAKKLAHRLSKEEKRDCVEMHPPSTAHMYLI